MERPLQGLQHARKLQDQVLPGTQRPSDQSQSSHVAQKGLVKKWQTGKDVNYSCSICITWAHIGMHHEVLTFMYAIVCA